MFIYLPIKIFNLISNLNYDIIFNIYSSIFMKQNLHISIFMDYDFIFWNSMKKTKNLIDISLKIIFINIISAEPGGGSFKRKKKSAGGLMWHTSLKSSFVLLTGCPTTPTNYLINILTNQLTKLLDN